MHGLRWASVAASWTRPSRRANKTVWAGLISPHSANGFQTQYSRFNSFTTKLKRAGICHISHSLGRFVVLNNIGFASSSSHIPSFWLLLSHRWNARLSCRWQMMDKSQKTLCLGRGSNCSRMCHERICQIGHTFFKNWLRGKQVESCVISLSQFVSNATYIWMGRKPRSYFKRLARTVTVKVIPRNNSILREVRKSSLGGGLLATCLLLFRAHDSSRILSSGIVPQRGQEGKVGHLWQKV